jgi:hypothetical protein
MSVSMCLEHVEDKNNCFACLEWTGPAGASVKSRHVLQNIIFEKKNLLFLKIGTFLSTYGA